MTALPTREAIEKLKRVSLRRYVHGWNMPGSHWPSLAEALQHLEVRSGGGVRDRLFRARAGRHKVSAIDYLVKPVETRGHRATRAGGHCRPSPVEKGARRFSSASIKIRFVMARDDYAYLQTDTDRYFSTVSLAQLEKRLDGHGFFRVHRGYLVNLSMVEEIESVSGGTLLLTLNGVEEKIPVSRRRVSSLKKALNL